jgi:hypothetical protein
MRRWIVVSLVASAMVAGGAIAGCMLVTGSTDGYEESDAGADTGPSTTVIPGCRSAASCESAGGDAGPQVCCVSLTALSASCEPSTCAVGDIQLCSTSAECGPAGACNMQSCSAGGVPLAFLACGTVMGCLVASGAPGPDSGIDSGMGAAVEGGTEAAADAGSDAATDAGSDAAADAADAAD